MWVMVNPDGARVRLVLLGGALLRLEEGTKDDWWVRSAYLAHPDRAHEKALAETASLEAWGHVLQKGTLLGKMTDIDPDRLYYDTGSNTRIGPLLLALLDGPWETL